MPAITWYLFSFFALQRAKINYLSGYQWSLSLGDDYHWNMGEKRYRQELFNVCIMGTTKMEITVTYFSFFNLNLTWIRKRFVCAVEELGKLRNKQKEKQALVCLWTREEALQTESGNVTVEWLEDRSAAIKASCGFTLCEVQLWVSLSGCRQSASSQDAAGAHTRTTRSLAQCKQGPSLRGRTHHKPFDPSLLMFAVSIMQLLASNISLN